MDKQVIIAISREYGSGGHEIAKIIADDMGLNLYDRSLLDEIAREKDIKIEYLEKYDEKPKKTYLSRRVGAYTNSIEEIITEMQFDFIREKAASGESFVIVGRCAETVLKDNKGLISIFVVGDKESKIARLQRVFNISKKKPRLKEEDMIRQERIIITVILILNGVIQEITISALTAANSAKNLPQRVLRDI